MKNPMLLVWLCLLVSSVTSAEFEKSVSVTVTWSEEDGYQIHQSGAVHSKAADILVASATYSNAINETGWGRIEIKTSDDAMDSMQAYAGGLAEGYLTKDMIYMFWQNMGKGECEKLKDTCGRIKSYMKKNTAWVKSMVSLKRYKDPYWHQVGLYYEQLDGLRAGYRMAAQQGEDLEDLDFLWMNMLGDLLDLQVAFANKTSLGSPEPRFGMCSGFIKVLPDAKDIYFGHDAWYFYRSMLRMVKKYEWSFHETPDRNSSIVVGRAQSMSSYPAMLFSMDDFYLVSSGLAVTETSISNYNQSLWKLIVPVGGLISGVRATAANRLAMDGQSWTYLYGRYNSGTYNNQWMVLDYKKFKPGQTKLKPGLLYVLEQMPGHIETGDQTAVLQKQGYWPSYNVPYYDSIFQVSDQGMMVAKYGDFFTYSGAPRAQIFARDHSGVTDLTAMTHIMRYNNYLHDPLATCNCTPSHNAVNAIAARADLNPKNGSYPFGILANQALGATDMKVTSSGLFGQLEFLAGAGPTFGDVPEFRWSQSGFDDEPHYGQPDLWKFDPVHVQWSQ